MQMLLFSTATGDRDVYRVSQEVGKNVCRMQCAAAGIILIGVFFFVVCCANMCLARCFPCRISIFIVVD